MSVNPRRVVHKKALAVEGTDLENVAEESGEEVCSEDRAKHGEMNGVICNF